MHMRNSPEIRESRGRWQALRQANDVILKEMPPTISEVETTIKELRASLVASAPRGVRSPREPEELTAGHRRLLAFLDASRAWQVAAKQVKPALERIREPGGQPSPSVAFARYIARHILGTWELLGFMGWSLYADGPFITFLVRLLNEVYGKETDHGALARALRRDEEIQQFASRREGT
jgi:hypothetical protein